MPAPPLIELRNIAFAYHQRHGHVLEGVNLSVPQGGVTALVGRSGVGKSSLLHLIAGLARPFRGEVLIDGQIIEGPAPRAVMMFQSPSLYPWLSVAGNAGLGLRFARRPKPEIASRVAAALALVGLRDAAGRKAGALSGGQAQRVALARALVMEPDVLLLDEPFAALDLFSRRALQSDIREIGARLGITIVLVSHDIPEVARMADRAVFLGGKPACVLAQEPVDPSARGDAAALVQESNRLAAFYQALCGADATPAGNGLSAALPTLAETRA
jgi:NitT/TauT family transport system ATP-binding protein